MIGRRPKKPRQPKAPPKSLLNYLSSERVGLRGRKKATQKPVAKPKAVTVTGKNLLHLNVQELMEILLQKEEIHL